MFLVAGAAVLLGLFAHQILGESGYLKLRDRRIELHKLEDEVRRLSEENQRLVQQIKRLQDDPRAIERIAREEMKLARPGEVIYTLPAPAPARPR